MKRALLDIIRRFSFVYKHRVLTLTVLLTLGTGISFAQNYERLSDIEAETFANALIVNSNDYQTIKNVRRYWVQESQRLKQMKQLEFVLTGSNEAVLKVTIPARLLFAQNDSTLLPSADNILRPFLRMVKGNESVATLVIGGYHDNNGSAAYLKTLSGGRARQVHRWFAHQGVGPAEVRSFGFGNQVPRTDNATIAQREKNRRITLYFVPTKKMLRAAKKGNL